MTENEPLAPVVDSVASSSIKPTPLRSGCKADTSPPTGMLPVNRPFGLVYQRQHTLNQQFDNVRLRHGDNAFTRVNAQ